MGRTPTLTQGWGLNLARIIFVATFAVVIIWLLLRSDTAALLRKGDEWMAAGRWHYAADAYNEALNRDGSQAARLGLARAEYALGEYTTTLNLTSALLRENNPDWHAATLIIGGMAAGLAGDDSTVYLQAAADTAVNPLVQRIATRRLAEARWARQDYAPALAAYHSIAVSSDPPISSVPGASQPIWDSVSFDATSDRQREVYYDTLLHTADNLTGTVGIMRALTLPELKAKATTYASAVDKARQLAADGSDDAAVSTALGAAYISIDECGLARATLDSAAFNMDANKPLPDLFAYRSVCRIREGDMVGAKADLERALKIDPNSALAHHLYARYYLAQSPPDFTTARHQLDLARDADATNPLLYLDYYQIALDTSDYTAAEQALTVFAGFTQNRPELDGLNPKARLANFYLDTGYQLCNGSGLQVAEAAGQVGDAAGLDAQGWAEHICNTKQADAGLVPLSRAVQLDPDNPRAHYHLGAVYARMGRNTDAQDQLIWAQDLAPNSTLAAKALDVIVRLGSR